MHLRSAGEAFLISVRLPHALVDCLIESERHCRLAGQFSSNCLSFSLDWYAKLGKFFPWCPGPVAQLVGASSCALKVCMFHSLLGRMQQTTDGCLSLTSVFLSLSLLLPQSLKSIKTIKYPWVKIKKHSSHGNGECTKRPAKTHEAF